jgi:hypothetical protein
VDLSFVLNCYGELLDLAESLLDDEIAGGLEEDFYAHGQALLEALVQLLHDERKRGRSLIIPLSLLRRFLFICPSLFTRFEHLAALLALLLFTTSSETEQRDLLGVLSILLNALPAAAAASPAVHDFVLPFLVFPLLHSVASSPSDPQARLLSSKLLTRVEVMMQTKLRPQQPAGGDSADGGAWAAPADLTLDLVEKVGLVDLFKKAEKLQRWVLSKDGGTCACVCRVCVVCVSCVCRVCVVCVSLVVCVSCACRWSCACRVRVVSCRVVSCVVTSGCQ